MTSTSAGSEPPASYRSFLPRLTVKVMVDLRLWMLAFGLLIGTAFPFVVAALGVPSSIAMRPNFFAATLFAGLVVAEVNYQLTRTVVGVRVRSLAAGMRRVEGSLVVATTSGDWTDRDPVSIILPLDSTDEFGEVSASFNRLVNGLATSQRVSDDIKAISQALAAHLELAALAESALREIVPRTGCDAAALLVVANGRIDLAGASGVRDAGQLAEAETIATVLRTGQASTLHLPADAVVNGTLVDFAPQEVQVLPVRYGVVSIGALVVAFARPSTPESAVVLNATLPGLAVALNNALNHEDLQRVAALDPLTGVYNRRFGLQRLTEEFARSIRSGDPLGLLMLDIDRFKAVNDTYGHLVGDRVLQAVVRVIRRVLREGDVLMRYGGEEFLVVLPGAGHDDLSQMAERVHHAAAEAQISEAGQQIRITLSIGASGLPSEKAADPQELIGLADSALYLAKAAGRDRWYIV